MRTCVFTAAAFSLFAWVGSGAQERLPAERDRSGGPAPWSVYGAFGLGGGVVGDTAILLPNAPVGFDGIRADDVSIGGGFAVSAALGLRVADSPLSVEGEIVTMLGTRIDGSDIVASAFEGSDAGVIDGLDADANAHTAAVMANLVANRRLNDLLTVTASVGAGYGSTTVRIRSGVALSSLAEENYSGAAAYQAKAGLTVSPERTVDVPGFTAGSTTISYRYFTIPNNELNVERGVNSPVTYEFDYAAHMIEIGLRGYIGR